MNKKEQIEKLKRVISIRNGMINDLHELIGAERERAETFKKEADVWKDRAMRLEQKLKRRETPILQGGKEAETPKKDDLAAIASDLAAIASMVAQMMTDVRMLKGMVNRTNGTTTTMISGYVDTTGSAEPAAEDHI